MAERKLILILSGEIGSGKSTLATKLHEKYNFKVLKTNERIKDECLKKKLDISNREIMQKIGENFDKKTKGVWVRSYFQEIYGAEFSERNLNYVIDSVRIQNQIDAFRESYSHNIIHVHLIAGKGTLKDRYLDREKNKGKSELTVLDNYEHYKNDETEKPVNSLEKDADLVIDTDKCRENDVLTRVAGFLKLLPSLDNRLVDVIVGGQFGSEGKGQIAGYLAPEYDCLIRVGGPNAGHSVYEGTGKHIFHLLPSGCHRNQDAKIILASGCVLNEEKILKEILTYLPENGNRLLIDENATIITQEDIDYENAIKDNIGSTAQGVGHATAGNILQRLYADDKHKAKNSKLLKAYIGNAQEELEKLYSSNKKILLEGTQGTSLSLYHGLYPYVTSRDTSVSGCLSEIGIAPGRVRKVIMVTRTYPIRVGGNSGDFGSKEISWKIISERSGVNISELTSTEKTTTTKKDRRVAEFSWDLFRKSCELNSPTDIALTFVDYISSENKSVSRYEQLTLDTKNFIEELERCSGLKVSLISKGFDYRSIIDRRNWK
jgi:adenylosuccinate synthase